MIAREVKKKRITDDAGTKKTWNPAARERVPKIVSMEPRTSSMRDEVPLQELQEVGRVELRQGPYLFGMMMPPILVYQ